MYFLETTNKMSRRKAKDLMIQFIICILWHPYIAILRVSSLLIGKSFRSSPSFYRNSRKNKRAPNSRARRRDGICQGAAYCGCDK